MSAYKIVQKISDLSTGISTSGPIALKSGYLRIVPETDAYIEVDSNPGVSTSNSIWAKAGTELILKETVVSQRVVGVDTGATTTIYLPEGTFSSFSVGRQYSAHDHSNNDSKISGCSNNSISFGVS